MIYRVGEEARDYRGLILGRQELTVTATVDRAKRHFLWLWEHGGCWCLRECFQQNVREKRSRRLRSRYPKHLSN